MSFQKNIWICVVLVFILLVSGCDANSAAPAGEDARITVYTSFYTMYDFTLKIAGDRVRIINMVPSGMEPHDWEPSPKDIAGLSKADLFIYNGAGMEHWADKVLESIQSSKLLAVETSRGIKLEEHAHQGHENQKDANQEHENQGDAHQGYEHEDDEKDGDGHSHEDLQYDPHVWLDPMNAKIQMKSIRDGLIQADPVNKQVYEDNFTKYAAMLDDMDKTWKTTVASFKRKEIVVAHEAFGYLCNAYGLKQVAIEGISSESEPTLAKMAEIINFVREHDVQVIFFEELASPKVAEAIARETGAGTALLNPLEGLTKENLDMGKDYFSVMEDNLKALKHALQ